MARKIKNQQNKKSLFSSGLTKLAAVAVIAGCSVLIMTTQRDCADKQKELSEIQSKIDTYTEENAELKKILDSDDISDYMEKVALEERDYAYPDERRFYDTSRD